MIPFCPYNPSETHFRKLNGIKFFGDRRISKLKDLPRKNTIRAGFERRDSIRMPLETDTLDPDDVFSRSNRTYFPCEPSTLPHFVRLRQLLCIPTLFRYVVCI